MYAEHPDNTKDMFDALRSEPFYSGEDSTPSLLNPNWSKPRATVDVPGPDQYQPPGPGSAATESSVVVVPYSGTETAASDSPTKPGEVNPHWANMIA